MSNEEIKAYIAARDAEREALWADIKRRIIAWVCLGVAANAVIMGAGVWATSGWKTTIDHRIRSAWTVSQEAEAWRIFVVSGAAPSVQEIHNTVE